VTLHVFTFWQQLAAELVYRAAMKPAQERGSAADCARAVDMRVSEFLRALRVLDVVRCGRIDFVQPPAALWHADDIRAWLRVLGRDR
jgi:hypothetical protein